MSGVKRYQADWHGMFLDLPGRRMGTEERLVVLASDFDRVTAELASANADKEAYAQNAIDLRKRVDALQQRLATADERVVVLEGLLRDQGDLLAAMHSSFDDKAYWLPVIVEECNKVRAALKPAKSALGEIDLTPKILAHAESVIVQQNNLIASLRAELVESYSVSAQPQGEPVLEDRETLIGYGRSSGLDEASTLCSRLAWAAYYPPGTRFKTFTPKSQKALGDLLIRAANEIASLPGGPYERFKARQAKKAESAKSR